MKKILSCLLLAALLIGLLAGCTPDAQQSTTTGGTQQPGTSSGTQPTQTGGENMQLTINGTDISAYKIVYAKHLYLQFQDKEALGSDYDFNKQSAEKLQACIKELTGVELECVQDISAQESDHEILVGLTNRSLTKDLGLAKQGAYDYRLSVEGSKLVICGAAFGNTWHAIDFLMENITANAGNASAYDLAAGLDLSGQNHLTTIACVGDSLTEGSKTTNAAYNYPSTLQRLLWKDCVVYNYGYGGYCLRKDQTNNIFKTGGWSTLSSETEKFDIVLIMLGTNDCGEGADSNWNDNSSEIYKSYMNEFVSTLAKNNPEIINIVMNCPPYYGSGARSRNLSKVRQAQQEAVDALKAQGYNIDLFDTFTYAKDNIGTERFPDQIHMNDEGYVLFAQGVAQMLKDCGLTNPLLGSYAQ